MTPAERPAVERRLLALRDALANLDRPDLAQAATLTNDPVLRAAAERWLQVAVEACIDLATHLIGAAGWTPPETGRAAFLILAARGRLDATLAERLGRAVGLRNLLVHDYAVIDGAILARVIREDLGDLRTFARAAASWFEGADRGDRPSE